MADKQGNTETLQPILNRLNAGDERATDDLIEHSMERLRRLTRKMLRENPAVHRWEQTDDVFQNALLRLHRALKAAKPTSVRDFVGLAARQIRWELTDMFRQHYPEGEEVAHYISDPANADLQGKESPLHERADKQPGPFTQLLIHEQIQALPDEEREVFELIFYQGMEQAEVAELLDVAVITVKRRWRSARLILHKTLKADSS